MKLAKIRHRVMATLLDNAIIFLCVSVCLFNVWIELIYSLVNSEVMTSIMVFSFFRAGMFYALFLLFYYMVVPIVIFKGQTIGKRIFKIKVVCDGNKDVDYKVLFFREAICRILVRVLSMGLSGVVSFVIMLIRDDKKSLADVFAKTKVIDIKGEF